MTLNLSGKYWNMSDLEKKLGQPSYKIYPVLNSIPGVIKVGYSFLMPDYLMPILEKELKENKYYTISTVSRLVGSYPEIIKLLITNGLPCFTFDDQQKIEKSLVPVIKNAISEAKKQDSFNNRTAFAQFVVEFVLRSIEKENQKGVDHV